MAQSPVYHIAFCIVGVAVLKEVNSIVTKPYMVCVVLLTALISTKNCVVYRTSHFMYHKPKRTATVNGPLGIQRLPPLPDCICVPPIHTPGTTDLCPTDIC